MNTNNRGPDSSGTKLFLVSPTKSPRVSSRREGAGLKKFAGDALLLLVLICLAIAALLGSGMTSINNIFAFVLPSVSAFLGGAAGARSGFKR